MVFGKTIAEVVDDNPVYARALHYLGIDFFENAHVRLEDICRERHLNKQQLIKSFYEFDSAPRASFKELASYPLELLIEYLKHTHHLFIKERLPYIVHLAKASPHDDLRNLMPEFIEDLIRHIYEEEDTTFKYINALIDIKKGRDNAPVSSLMPFEGFSLAEEWAHHEEEDELRVVRSLMPSLSCSHLREKVLLNELKSFDREMVYHAAIENQLLFPEAIAIEKEVMKKTLLLSLLN